jgi:hypothetical protein
MRRTTLLLVLLFVLLPLHLALGAQLTRGVAASGGVLATTERTGLVLSGTLGQPGVGSASAGAFLDLGFWYWPPATPIAVPDAGTGDTSGFLLLAGFPNPSAGAATISFAIPRRMQVTIRVYDIAGHLVQTLTDAVWDAGTHDLSLQTDSLAGGLYLCRMTAEGTSLSQRLVFLK